MPPKKIGKIVSRTRPRSPGRPPLDRKEERERSKRWAESGDRLWQALNDVGFSSQTEVADRSGIPQSRISEFRSGKRPIGSDDLRRLGALGVSADYVLGLVSANIPPGQSRSRSSLEWDLENAVLRQLRKAHPPVTLEPGRDLDWVVSGEGLLQLLIESVEPLAIEEIERAKEYQQLKADLDAVSDVANRLVSRLAPEELDVEQVVPEQFDQHLFDQQQLKMAHWEERAADAKDLGRLLVIFRRLSDGLLVLRGRMRGPVILLPREEIRYGSAEPG